MKPLRWTALSLALLGVLTPGSARAASSYCSSSGDVCYSAKKRDGAVRLGLGTFALRGTVDVCVRAPDATRKCVGFRLRERARGIFEIDARWSAHFPRKGPGTYRVTFVPRGIDTAIGPPVTFALKG